MDYINDCKIDESALDVECHSQTKLAMQYGINWAEKTRDFTLAEENVKLVRSNLIEKINKDPEKYLGVGLKPTGPNVEAAYRNHKLHIEAKNTWVEAMYQLNLAVIAKSAIMVTKKEELENLIKLHGQNYFAGPSVPRDLPAEIQLREKKEKELNRTISLKRSRNK